MRFKAPYVSFRNGHAHFMIRVPLDLIGKFNSQYIRKSLKTSQPKEAKLLASSMALKVMSAFSLLRSEILSEEQTQILISSYKEQIITEEADGSIILELKTSGWFDVKRWILSFGSKAEVIEPEKLRQEIKEELSKTLEHYR